MFNSIIFGSYCRFFTSVNYSFMNYCVACVTGLVEQYDLPHVLSHVERDSARLVVHVHLQGHVRNRDAIQPRVVSYYCILHLCHCPRIHSHICTRFFLSCNVYFIYHFWFSYVLDSQDCHQQPSYVVDFEPWLRSYIQSANDRVLCETKLFASPQLLCRSVYTAKLELSGTINFIDPSHLHRQ